MTIEITIAYDFAEFKRDDGSNHQLYKVYPVDEPASPRAQRKQQRIAARDERKKARVANREYRRGNRSNDGD